MTDTPEDFDWSNDDDVVSRRQDSLAIYSDERGQVVLRRERDWDEEADVCILIAPERAPMVAHAILEAAGLGNVQFYRVMGGSPGLVDFCEDIDWRGTEGNLDETSARRTEAEPKDRTAAERQRRRRAKQRDRAAAELSSVTEPVTDRDGELRLVNPGASNG
jgi:hypothetical protein